MLSLRLVFIAFAGLLLIVAGPVLGAARGALTLESQWLSDTSDGSSLNQSADGELGWRGTFINSLSGMVQVYGRFDSETASHNAVLLDEAWVEGQWRELDFRVGQQRISWGVMEGTRVTDSLNASDFQKDLIEPRKIASPTARFRYWKSNHTLGFYWQPVTATNLYPGPNSPSYFGGGQSRIKYLSESRLGVHYVFETRNYDFSTSWLRGPEVDVYTFPQIIFSEPISTERYGMSGQWFADDLILRAEAVHRRVLDEVEPSIGQVVRNETLYSFGFEYSMSQLFGRSDLTAIAEYYRSSDHKRAGALNNDLFIGAELRFNDLNSQTLEVFLQEAFLGRNDRFLRARYGRLLTESIEMALEYTRARGIYAGAAGSAARNEFALSVAFGF